MKEIRKLIQTETPPQEWFCDRNHPINKICYLSDGPFMKLVWLEEELEKTPELLLWHLYSAMLKDSRDFYEEAYDKTCDQCHYSHPNEQAQKEHKQHSRVEFINNAETQWIDTGYKPYTNSAQFSNNVTGRIVARYECAQDRHLSVNIVEDMNHEVYKAVRSRMLEKGYTDILILPEDIIVEACQRAIAEALNADGAKEESEE